MRRGYVGPLPRSSQVRLTMLSPGMALALAGASLDPGAEVVLN